MGRYLDEIVSILARFDGDARTKLETISIAAANGTRGARSHRRPPINLRQREETIQAMLGCYESLNTKKIVKI